MSNTKIDASDLKTRFEAHFEALEAGLNGKSQLPLHQIRREAIENFKKLDFPNTKNEEWKYTNIAKILKPLYLLEVDSQLTQEQIKPFLFSEENAYLLVLVNGKLIPELSNYPETLLLSDLDEAFAQYPELIAQTFAQHLEVKTEVFTALNTALVEKGLCIKIQDHQVLDKPIFIHHFTDAQQGDIAVQPRLLILAGANSQASFLEKSDTLGNFQSLNNAVAEIFVGENAHIQHYKIQNDQPTVFYIGTTQVYQQKNSTYSNVTVSLNGAIIRNNLNILLDGENVESNMYGLYMLEGNTLVDNHSIADHKKPNSISNELYKGILDEKSIGVFNGKIYVRQDAQKTNAYQQNRNILLSDEAAINTKPQLEIWADDVKCSHGATTGNLDETALFYLRSRGISQTEARALLIQAFANEITQMIQLDSVQNYLSEIIAERLLQEKP